MYMLILFILSIFATVPAERVQYISTEHPEISDYNRNYIAYANLTSRRFGRGDPFYYVDFNMHALVPFGNNVTVSFYFFEFLSNVYKRSFVEMHFGACDLIEKDKIFGFAMRQGKFTQTCPFAAGAYNLYNMTIPQKHIPRNFPFKKGRIYCNITLTSNNDCIFTGHIDMEIKYIYGKKKPAN